MAQLVIILDPENAEYNDLRKEIAGFLASLETVEYKSVARPARPGQLAGEEDVFKDLSRNNLVNCTRLDRVVPFGQDSMLAHIDRLLLLD